MNSSTYCDMGRSQYIFNHESLGVSVYVTVCHHSSSTRKKGVKLSRLLSCSLNDPVFKLIVSSCTLHLYFYSRVTLLFL